MCNSCEQEQHIYRCFYIFYVQIKQDVNDRNVDSTVNLVYNHILFY